MSDIPHARILFDILIIDLEHRQLSSAETVKRLRQIMPLLWREPALRRAPGKPHKFTAEEKWRIKAAVRDNPGLTYHQIANRLGIRNTGRVSDIMHGKI